MADLEHAQRVSAALVRAQEEPTAHHLNGWAGIEQVVEDRRLLAAELGRVLIDLQTLRQYLAAEDDKPEGEGWVRFGTHANCHEPMEFSDIDEGGLPTWERVRSREATDDENLRTWMEERDQAEAEADRSGRG